MSAVPEPTNAADLVGTHGALRILVVDADDRTRESIVGILGIRHRFDVVGSAGHVAEALAIGREHRPDVVVLDPRLPEVTDGMALIRRLRAMDPDIAILAVGWSPDLEHRSLDAGADGFVRKTFKPGDLANAIARCMDRRVADAADDIALAAAGIARIKGQPGLVTMTDPLPLAGPDSTSQPVDDTPATASSAPSPRPVPTRGAGLIL
ncbi:MAG TPA: response regulator transcription factor [Candidatus Limnocylindrales bacterium]|jgi:DNA-binding NarL/FixJ family response regulator